MQNSARSQISIVKINEAITYVLLPSSDQIKVDTDGNIHVGTENTLTCKAYKVLGKNRTECDPEETTLFYNAIDEEGNPTLLKLYTDSIYPNATYKQYVFYLYDQVISASEINADFDNYDCVANTTVSVITDGQIDTYFKVWQGDLEDPNDPLDKPWLDSDSSHTGDYYIATNGYYWKFNGTVWVKLTDPLLTNIYNAISRSGNVGYYIDIAGDYHSPLEYFSKNDILYQLGDLMELITYDLYTADDITDLTENEDYKAVKIDGSSVYTYLDLKHPHHNMYMCCSIYYKRDGVSYTEDDWILSTNLEGRQKDAGLEIYKNDIVLTADRLKLLNTAGNQAAAINLFVKDNEGTEEEGLYINTNVLKLDSDVTVDGSFAIEGEDGSKIYMNNGTVVADNVKVTGELKSSFIYGYNRIISPTGTTNTTTAEKYIRTLYGEEAYLLFITYSDINEAYAAVDKIFKGLSLTEVENQYKLLINNTEKSSFIYFNGFDSYAGKSDSTPNSLFTYILPNPRTYDGLELNLYNYSETDIDNSSDAYKIVKLICENGDADKIQYPVKTFTVSSGTTTYQTVTDSYLFLPFNSLCTLKSINGYWLLINNI